MELLTAKLKKEFAKVGPQHDVKDPIILAKYFLPVGNWTFYAIAFDPSNELFTGIFQGEATECGEISLYHLESIIGPMRCKVERDKFFASVPMSRHPDPDIHRLV